VYRIASPAAGKLQQIWSANEGEAQAGVAGRRTNGDLGAFGAGTAGW
jgi:hypothetical protein